jgi:nucleoside 2-deoxyribosyltransferase
LRKTTTTVIILSFRNDSAEMTPDPSTALSAGVNGQMHLYFAGPLFTQAERAWNRAVAQYLEAGGHSVFLPQSEVLAIDTLEADAIFQVDVDGVRSADAIVAILDGADADSGTCFECGLAFALGIPIIGVRTDFRGGGDALPGQRLATVNLMLAQAASDIVHVPDPAAGADSFAASILQSLANLKTSSTPPPLSRSARRPPH